VGTAYGQVTDYLFTGTIVTAGPLTGQALKTQLALVDANVSLTDNYYTPGELIGGDSFVAIGRNSVDAASSSSSRVYLALGALKIEEQFDVPVLILTRGMGPAQKPIRDKALGLLDAFVHFVQQDLTLGGVLLNGRTASISGYQITQTETANDGAGGAMQTVEIAITLQCKNFYQP